MLLEELDIPLHKVRGIGPASQKALGGAEIFLVRDLAWHLPRDYEDRSVTYPFRSVIPSGGWVNTSATVLGHEYFGPPGRKNLKVLLEDEAGTQASLICFGRDFLARQLSTGLRILICGQAQYRFKEIQITSFEFEPWNPDDPEARQFRRILPRYPLTGDLNQGFFRRTMETIFAAYLGNLEEILPSWLLERHQLMDRTAALRQLHFPQSQTSLAQARHRLVYEELLLFQLEVLRRGLRRQAGSPDLATGSLPDRPAAPPAAVPDLAAASNPAAPASPVPVASGTATPPGLPAPDSPALCDLSRRLLASLPFSLTTGQLSALAEITADLGNTVPMSRLLQGDVGSGKTLVAFLACLEVIARGCQAALLVPTVLLARQHAANAHRLLGPLGVEVALMAGPLAAGVRKELVGAIRDGRVQLVIGTHGLFSSDVDYADLRLVVIDEQHRFGVLQRQALYQKASFPNLLMMSATPIPQTLALTVFGDMEVSVIRGLPAARQAIDTHLARMGNETKVYDWVRKELAAGHQAYFVYPLIEGDDDPEGELKNACAMFDTLSGQVYPDIPCAMIHSRMDEEAKAAAMASFAAGTTRILVATSVVEVGVDVPNATCMVVEHAERFGLSALHQLRGRVGRGSAKSWCFLVYREPLAEEGKQRLMVMKQEHDGFVIAEEDLRLRGPGDLRGLRQSGAMRLRIADLSRDMEIMHLARADARQVLERDPGLVRPEHLLLDKVLGIMEKQEPRTSPAG